MNRSFIRATLTLVGTIIGAGIFALPEAFAQVGLWKGSLVFWGIAFIVCATHLMMVDVELSLPRKLRLAGAVRHWLGKGAFLFTAFTYPCQLLGASLAYLLLGAAFLEVLLAPLFPTTFSTVVWQVLFWGGGALTVVAGLRVLAKVETWATWFLVAALLLGSVLVVGKGSVLGWSSGWGQAFGLFGLCLFSLGGIPGIGEVVEIAERRRGRAYLATVIGSLLAALVSWLFAVSFAGNPQARPFLAWILSLAGLLAVATSFVVMMKDLESTFRLDFGISRRLALMYALAIPLLLAFVTTADLLGVIDTVGTIFGGSTGILVALTASKVYGARRVRRVAWYEFACLLVAGAYVLGMAHWVWERVLY